MDNKKKIKEIEKNIVESIGNAENDYDDAKLIENELWDHYSGLPNPNWYAQNEKNDK